MSVVAAIRRMLASGLNLEDALTAAEAFEAEALVAAPTLTARQARNARYYLRRKSWMPDNWPELRQAAFERDRYVCTYCGDRPECPECDHVVPLSRGGTSELSNLTTACEACNTKKGDRTPEEWLG